MFITEALYLRENQRRRGDVYCLHKKCGYFTAKISASEWVGACSHTQ